MLLQLLALILLLVLFIAKSLGLVTGPTEIELNELGDSTTIPYSIVVHGSEITNFN